MSNNTFISSDGKFHVYFLLPIRCCLPQPDLWLGDMPARVIEF